MISTNHAFRKHLTGAVMMLVAVAALSGCGGSEDYRAPPGNPAGPVTPQPPVSMVDSFFSYVTNLVGTLLDDAEPASIDEAAVTTPENTEPEPVTVAN